MSTQREERFRLVEELPGTEAPAAALLDDVRRHLRAVNRSWPPAWLGASQGSTL